MLSKLCAELARLLIGQVFQILQYCVNNYILVELGSGLRLLGPVNNVPTDVPCWFVIHKFDILRYVHATECIRCTLYTVKFV